jgi:imidazolonepropionase-like amidohydrolase
MSGLRDPYPDGELGVIKEGAYADMLLVDGNPLEDLDAVTDQDNLKIIMKDGVIYKNSL